MLSRVVTRVVAAAALVAATYAGVPTSPAAAAPCGSADGVTVVVDFHELGGGVRSVCVPEGGDRYASDLFPAAGFPLAYVQRQPDFVCRVSGLPTAEDACVATPPATAYWSLWWTDGDGGDWRYSTSNAGGLRIPDGGYVAFSWNTGSRPVPPGSTPAAHPAPKPTKKPAPTPTPKSTPTRAPTASASASPTPKPKPSATTKPKPEPRPTPSASPTVEPEASVTPTPTSAEPAADDDGLPAWAAPAAIVLLFAGAGVAAALRRRRTSGS